MTLITSSKAKSGTTHSCLWEECRCEFSDKADYLVHAEVHSSELTDTCRWDDCTRSFPSHTDFENHVNRHFDYRPFACREAGCKVRCFTRKERLKHEGTHDFDELCSESASSREVFPLVPLASDPVVSGSEASEAVAQSTEPSLPESARYDAPGHEQPRSPIELEKPVVPPLEASLEPSTSHAVDAPTNYVSPPKARAASPIILAIEELAPEESTATAIDSSLAQARTARNGCPVSPSPSIVVGGSTSSSCPPSASVDFTSSLPPCFTNHETHTPHDPLGLEARLFGSSPNFGYEAPNTMRPQLSSPWQQLPLPGLAFSGLISQSYMQSPTAGHSLADYPATDSIQHSTDFPLQIRTSLDDSIDSVLRKVRRLKSLPARAHAPKPCSTARFQSLEPEGQIPETSKKSICSQILDILMTKYTGAADSYCLHRVLSTALADTNSLTHALCVVGGSSRYSKPCIEPETESLPEEQPKNKRSFDKVSNVPEVPYPSSVFKRPKDKTTRIRVVKPVAEMRFRILSPLPATSDQLERIIQNQSNSPYYFALCCSPKGYRHVVFRFTLLYVILHNTGPHPPEAMCIEAAARLDLTRADVHRFFRLFHRTGRQDARLWRVTPQEYGPGINAMFLQKLLTGGTNTCCCFYYSLCFLDFCRIVHTSLATEHANSLASFCEKYNLVNYVAC